MRLRRRLVVLENDRGLRAAPLPAVDDPRRAERRTDRAHKRPYGGGLSYLVIKSTSLFPITGDHAEQEGLLISQTDLLPLLYWPGDVTSGRRLTAAGRTAVPIRRALIWYSLFARGLIILSPGKQSRKTRCDRLFTEILDRVDSRRGLHP